MLISVLSRVFSQYRYVALQLSISFLVVSAALLLPNLQAIKQVIFSGAISIGAKIYFIASLYGSLVTNFTLLSATYLILVGLLFGINIALLVFYVRQRQTTKLSKGAHLSSLGGIISATLGIGCAACGSVVLTSAFGLAGASSILIFLPLNGLEFGIVGLALLLFSTYYLLKKISDPLVCPVQ